MTHIAIITDDGTIHPVTTQVETIFRKGLPEDWEDYMDDDAVTAICQIAILLGEEGWDDRLAAHLEEIRRRAEQLAKYHAERERYKAQLDERERNREAKRAETMTWLNELAQSWLETGQLKETEV